MVHLHGCWRRSSNWNSHRYSGLEENETWAKASGLGGLGGESSKNIITIACRLSLFLIPDSISAHHSGEGKRS